MKSPPINYGPLGFETTCEVSVPVYCPDSAGRPTATEATETYHVPCTIEPSGASETMRLGDGLVNESTTTWVAFLPRLRASGVPLALPASSVIIADSIAYEVKGEGQAYADGLQRVPVEIKT